MAEKLLVLLQIKCLLIEEQVFYSEMKNIFSSLMNDLIFASNVIKFITEYKLEEKNTKDFESHGEYYYLKNNNIKSYRTYKKTLNGRILF